MAYKDFFHNYTVELAKNTSTEYARNYVKAGLYTIAFPPELIAKSTTENYFQTESFSSLLNNLFNINNQRSYQRGSLLVIKYNTTRDSVDLYLNSGERKDLLIQSTSPFGESFEEIEPTIGSSDVNFQLFIQTCSINVTKSLRIINTTPKGFEGFISEITGVNGYDVSLDLRLYDNYYTKPVQFMQDVLTMLDKKIITLNHNSLDRLGANKFIVKNFSVTNQLDIKNSYSFSIELISYDNNRTDVVSGNSVLIEGQETPWYKQSRNF